MSQGDAVPGAALDRAVQGVNLRPGSLRDQIGREPTLPVFLRHFGSSGARMGDVWRMPGLFLVAEDRLLWSHRFRHAGDHPEFAEIPRLAALAEAPTPPT